MPEEAPVMTAVPWCLELLMIFLPRALTLRGWLSACSPGWVCPAMTAMSYKRRFRTSEPSHAPHHLPRLSGLLRHGPRDGLGLRDRQPARERAALRAGVRLRRRRAGHGVVRNSPGVRAVRGCARDTLVVGGATVPAPSTPGM